MKAIRGANSVKTDTPESISFAANELFSKMLACNDLVEADIVGLIISHTKDLRSLNSATALRRTGKCKEVPLFCVQEADIEGSMPHAIRMMMFVEKPSLSKVSHVYLGETAKLRPDLNEEAMPWSPR